MNINKLALPFTISACCFITACGGSSNSDSTTADVSVGQKNINTTAALPVAAPHLSIHTDRSEAVISWVNESNIDYDLYWGSDASLDSDNYSLLDGDMIPAAQSPISLPMTVGSPLFVRIEATNADNESVLGNTYMVSQFNENAINESGKHFVKLNGDGEVLQDSADDWPCVLDTVTGLIWQVDADQAMKRYAWNEDNRAPSDNSVGICDSYVADSCTTQRRVYQANTETACNQTRWRLPKVKELQGLADFNHSYPAINTDYFPHTQNGHYWAAEIFANNSDYAWNVSFDFGHSGASPTDASMDDLGYVRLVAKPTNTVFQVAHS